MITSCITLACRIIPASRAVTRPTRRSIPRRDGFVFNPARSVHLMLPNRYRRALRNSIINEDYDKFITEISRVGCDFAEYAYGMPGAPLSPDRFIEKITNFEHVNPKPKAIVHDMAYNLSRWCKSPLYFCALCIERICVIYEERCESRHLPLCLYKAKRDRLLKIIAEVMTLLHGEFSREEVARRRENVVSMAVDLQKIPTIPRMEVLAKLVEIAKTYGGYVWLSIFSLTEGVDRRNRSDPSLSLDEGQISAVWKRLQERDCDLDCKIRFVEKIPTKMISFIPLDIVLKDIITNREYDAMLRLSNSIKRNPSHAQKIMHDLVVYGEELIMRMSSRPLNSDLRSAPRRYARYIGAIDSRIESLHSVTSILHHSLSRKDVSIAKLMGRFSDITLVDCANKITRLLLLVCKDVENIEDLEKSGESLLHTLITLLNKIMSSPSSDIIVNKMRVNLRNASPVLIKYINEELNRNVFPLIEPNRGGAADVLNIAGLHEPNVKLDEGSSAPSSPESNGEKANYIISTHGDCAIRILRVSSIFDAFEAQCLLHSGQRSAEVVFEIARYVEHGRDVPLLIIFLQGPECYPTSALFLNLEHNNSQIMFHTIPMFLSNSKIIKIFNDSEATLSLLYDALKDTPYERSEISRVVDLRAAATKLEQRMPGPIQPGFVHSKDYADRRHADALLKRYSREVQPPRNVAERHLISLASLYQTMYAQDRGLLLPPIAVSREPILEPPEKIPAFRIVNPIIRSHKHLRATREQLSTPNHHPYSAAISNRGTREVTIG